MERFGGRKNLTLVISAFVGFLLILMVMVGAGFLLFRAGGNDGSSGGSGALTAGNGGKGSAGSGNSNSSSETGNGNSSVTTGGDDSYSPTGNTNSGSQSSVPGTSTGNQSVPGSKTQPPASDPSKPPSNNNPTDPTNHNPDNPPADNTKNIAGSWALDLQGQAYSIPGLKMTLNKDGTVSVGQSSDLSLTVKSGSYTWNSNTGNLQLTADCEYNVSAGVSIPLEIKMTGTTDSSVKNGQGTFTAAGKGLYSSMTDSGAFKLSR